MKQIKLALKAIVESRSSANGKLTLPGEAVLVERGIPRWLILKCPCGCGEEIPINVDARAGKAWRIYRNKHNSITLYPSVWRDTGCGSHFIIWRNCIYLFGTTEDYYYSSAYDGEVELLAKRVLQVWPHTGLVTFVSIADKLNEIPWDVLEACRLLVRRGLLVEGSGETRGSFMINT